MTENEAKTKWCPFYRVATSGGDPSSTYEIDNRPRDGIPPPEGSPAGTSWAPGPNINPYACCIGSACMAWRLQSPTGFEHVTITVGTEGEKYTADIHGYCGLAGKP